MSEKRRLSIGVQLVRESVMVLLDEPTHGLEPLDAYLLVSILSNYAKKTGCGILLSMEKPRSDVFPFLDRALFLCLGGVVYSGSTRGMLEYFHSIGFPCPQLENPLMYYLCLSTVDRRYNNTVCFIKMQQFSDRISFLNFTGAEIGLSNRVNRSKHWCNVSHVKHHCQTFQSIQWDRVKFRCRMENRVKSKSGECFICKSKIEFSVFCYDFYVFIEISFVAQENPCSNIFLWSCRIENIISTIICATNGNGLNVDILQ